MIPALGAGLARYDWWDGSYSVPLFRPCRDLTQTTPLDLACNLLVPWSNRISGGGFWSDGSFYPLEPNLVGEPYPIHGNGFQHPWIVTQQTTSSVALSLHSLGPGPFHYNASVEYRLDAGLLSITLSVINRAPQRLPYGLGLHPWLPRSPGTLLAARAETLWLEDDRHLPAGSMPCQARPEWDFRSLQPLPPTWINNAFAGWDGRAEVVWFDRGIRLAVEAQPPLNTYILYSPSSTAGFFCFEPVSHLVDAHNLPDAPEQHGLVLLGPGEELSTTCRFKPSRI